MRANEELRCKQFSHRVTAFRKWGSAQGRDAAGAAPTLRKEWGLRCRPEAPPQIASAPSSCSDQKTTPTDEQHRDRLGTRGLRPRSARAGPQTRTPDARGRWGRTPLPRGAGAT
jgi:hypothetical protein